MQGLIDYFQSGVTSRTLRSIGMEVETQFIDDTSEPITTAASQAMLTTLSNHGWQVSERKGQMITELTDNRGNRISYELGRHNIELATASSTAGKVLSVAKVCLDQLYEAAAQVRARAFFRPILPGSNDLLVIPDERDAVWLELDGRKALMPLARTSSVQFTISVAVSDAIRLLNALGENIKVFLAEYPQDAIWHKYIATSKAAYKADRYGGPLRFAGLDEYCQKLISHDVVQGTRLVPFAKVQQLDIPLFLRSVWWYFRLKRYGDALCIEVRPLPRCHDDYFSKQLEKVLSIVSD